MARVPVPRRARGRIAAVVAAVVAVACFAMFVPVVAIVGSLASSNNEAASLAGCTVTGGTSATGASGTGTVVASLPDAVGAYRGEQVTNAAYVIKAGQSMGLDAWTITVGVMTAMGESSLRNIGYGDEAGPDSRGLFQQRDSWGTLAERMNPTTAAKKFFSALIKVDGYRSLSPTIAAHRTQRNADPNHYTKFWSSAVTMVSTLTADPSLLSSLKVSDAVDAVACDDLGGVVGDGTASAVVAAAAAYLGTPYSWGGGGVGGPSYGFGSGAGTKGFDCSGLVQYAVHRGAGITLPRTAAAQSAADKGTVVARYTGGQTRDFSLLKAGDVVYFNYSGSTSSTGVEHTGIYVGDGKMLHAPHTGDVVKYTTLKGSSYWNSAGWIVRRYTAS